MLQRDYIQRLIREFMAALERMLEKNEVVLRREEIRKMYDQYVGPYALYHDATIDEVMRALQSFDENERLDRMGMLAELYYAEADTTGDPSERNFLLEKAFNLFDFIDYHGQVFSLDRQGKMADIQRRLKG